MFVPCGIRRSGRNCCLQVGPTALREDLWCFFHLYTPFSAIVKIKRWSLFALCQSLEYTRLAISGGVGPTKISPVKQEARKRSRAVCLKG